MAVIYYSVAVHLRGFGSYRQLLVLIFNQSMVTQLVVAASILLAVVTGHDNIYSIPEYAGGQDGKTLFHAAAHLVVGLLGSLVFWLFGCLILWITKMAARRSATA